MLEAKKMKIGIFSRFPPLQGGVSSETYWDSVALGKKGIETVIISNSWSGNYENRINLDVADMDYFNSKNLKLYMKNPFSNSNNFDSKGPNIETELFALGIEVEKKENLDIIEGFYLFPYGVSAWSLSKLYKKPLIIKHAGSDFYSLQKLSYLPLIDVFKEADCILSRLDSASKMFGNEKIKKLGLAIPNEFNPHVTSKFNFEEPTIGFIGKYNSFKRIKELTEELNKINLSYKFLILTDKKGQVEINKILPPKVKKNSIFMDFTAPWNMPSIYASLDILYCGETGFDINEHFPKVALEGFSSGVCTLLSDEIFNKYKDIFNLLDGENVIKFNPLNGSEIKVKLESVLKDENLRSNISLNSVKIPKFNYNNYIDSLIQVYKTVLEK
jgi:glycosyltransferase involved in cell wall biosynthesis